ncbi:MULTISPECIES: DNA polymerase III subunit delta' [Clostridium]|jgi:DNA polymerase III subunit delta'|uniref:DNA polymerase III subunit delta' n=2 Tax=root TaxID=1 RepID=R9CF31_9CLOT|nr:MULTISPECIES: DNA polymerase III subunit delta' [Clostridium]EOR27892.1 DNA polymerase III subunit delta' [Clostridium sartagoforme AAU1]KLE17399.1 DNA polymerase III subunit delta' [Clostridium sp. C8]
MGHFIGHERIIESLRKRILTGEISHAHIIVGEDGIGKSNLAKLIAINILGGHQDRNYVDIVNYRCKKSSFGVDDVRDVVDEVSKKPFEGDKKVIIIHDGNKMTVQAQNALLKTIEEPPKGVFIILLCESLELILDTIKSRCQIYKLTPLTKDEVKLYIERLGTENYSNEEIKAAISYSEGIPGKAEKFLRDSSLKDLRNLLIDLLYILVNGNLQKLLDFEVKILSYKDKKEEILNILASFIRDIIVYKEVNEINVIINGDKIENIKQLAIEMSYKKLNKIIDKIGEARKTILSNSNFQLTIRVMLIGFMEV